ncbi:hypothetical protein ES692_06060 [Psychroserpens burtonensis]|uniref:BspA family leucine-rich repeat surface protein n=1 Tax=Psychroserpens burtonensis TaxID=49278 RepID=A0A5C7BGL9_9FLAO|nr:hypothetical protein [Psychroserpens burtonensis]TXE18605.1 hypothetical protein ES692_06060 [Psychroserpens burtonensis]
MPQFIYIPADSQDLDSFIMTVKTDNAGTSNNDQFTIPIQPAFFYNYNVKTSDGQDINNASTITFPSPGTYDIKITGTFPTILFANGGDKNKLLDIKQWGNIVWSTLTSSFQGCFSLGDVSATDTPDLSTATKITGTFRGSSLTSINFNDWDVSNIDDVNQFLLDTDFLDVSFSNWSVHQIRTFTNFARDIGMSTSNYDATLVGWEANIQSVYPSGAGYPNGSYAVNFRGVTYTSGGAGEIARASLITNFGWSFTDGGGV